MPSLIWTPESAITSTGREIAFGILGYVLYDLRHYRRVTFGEHLEMCFWVNSYRDGGALPGTKRFRSPYSDEQVLFTELLDDLLELWILATNWYDLTDDEDDVSTDPVDEDVDLYRPYPKDIGRFALSPRLEWFH